MKKTAALLFAALLVIVPMSAQATTEEAPVQEPVAAESIAIIDQQFNPSALGGNFTEVCVSACNINATPKSTNLVDFNHGTQMAEIIRKNNPSAHLVLIRAGATNVSPVTSLGLRDALTWISNNHKKYGIKVVSASINAGNSTTCNSLSGVSNSDIELSINELSAAGVSVIASAGNTMNRPNLNYPACISNVVAVSAPNRQGITNPNLDFILRPQKFFNLSTSVGAIAINNAITTSAATALVAANWSKLSSSPVNSRLQIKLDVLP
jgi:hypothetical protein